MLSVDDVGISITPDQDVRWPVKVEKPTIVFEKDVEIQRYLENIYKGKKFEEYLSKHLFIIISSCVRRFGHKLHCIFLFKVARFISN